MDTIPFGRLVAAGARFYRTDLHDDVALAHRGVRPVVVPRGWPRRSDIGPAATFAVRAQRPTAGDGHGSAARRQPVTLSLPAAVPEVETSCVFSTVRVIDGRPVLWAEHRRRLEHSAEQVHRAGLPPDLDDRVAAAAAAAAAARLRVRLSASSTVGVEAEVELTELPALDDAPRRLVAVTGRTGSWAHKWCDRRQLAAAAELVGRGQHPLFVDDDGHLLETATANLLLVDEISLLTPPCDGRVLPGVTRQAALAAAAALGLQVVQRPVTSADTPGRALLVTSSLAGVVTAASLDGNPTRQLPDLAERLRERAAR